MKEALKFLEFHGDMLDAHKQFKRVLELSQKLKYVCSDERLRGCCHGDGAGVSLKRREVGSGGVTTSGQYKVAGMNMYSSRSEKSVHKTDEQRPQTVHRISTPSKRMQKIYQTRLTCGGSAAASPLFTHAPGLFGAIKWQT